MSVDDRPKKSRAVVFVTRGPSKQMRSVLSHLHSGGIRHITEVRVGTDQNGARSCQRDRQMHQFVEEVVNGSAMPRAPQPWCWYRCMDFVALPEARGGSRVEDLVGQLSKDLNVVAAVPDCYDDLVELCDKIATGLDAPVIANQPETSGHRVHKAQMQRAVQQALGVGARQVTVSSAEEVEEAVSSLELPVIVKPAESAASDGVFVCETMEEIQAAVDGDLQGQDIYMRPHKEVVIQEYFQGQEFVVNTVSVQGQHQVVELWRAVKQREGSRIFYGHQELVLDSREHADVVSFSLGVLDAVGLQGGAAHLELVRTSKGCRLIEINPRPGGHEPRAARVLKQHQLGVLADAICRPEEFAMRAANGPHYHSDEPATVLVAFLRADKDAEVHRSDLLKIARMQSFERFDRVHTVQFADFVERSLEESFWIASKTDSLFTAPLVVILRGAVSQVHSDLHEIRHLEKSMYKPWGWHDCSSYAGVLEGGDGTGWYKEALQRETLPAEGTRLRALPGAFFQGDGTDHYVAGDVGTVTKAAKDRLVIQWDRTKLATSIGKLSWRRFFAIDSEPEATVKEDEPAQSAN